MRANVEFSELVGKRIDRFEGLHYGSECLRIFCTDGSEYTMYHDQECCENVAIEETNGNFTGLFGDPIIRAEVFSSEEYVSRDMEEVKFTFYYIASHKGDLTIRWRGSSNGYYSTSVTLEKRVYS